MVNTGEMYKNNEQILSNRLRKVKKRQSKNRKVKSLPRTIQHPMLSPSTDSDFEYDTESLEDIRQKIYNTITSLPTDLINIILQYIDNRIECTTCKRYTNKDCFAICAVSYDVIRVSSSLNMYLWL